MGSARLPNTSVKTSASDALLDGFARFILGNRYKVLLAWTIVTAMFASQLSRLDFDFSFITLFRSNDESVDRFLEYKQYFGDDVSYVSVVLTGENLFGPECLAWLDATGTSVKRLAGVEKVTHALNVQVPRTVQDRFEVSPLAAEVPRTLEEAGRFRTQLLENELVRGMLVSEDARVTAVLVGFADEFQTVGQREEVVDRVREVLERNPPPGGIEWFLTGIPFVQQRYRELVFEDQTVFLPIVTAVLCLFVLVFLRRWSFIPIAFVPVVCALIWTLGLMVVVGEGVNIINQVIPVTLMVVGVADAIHLLTRYQEEIGEGRKQDEAIRKTVILLARACFLTSITTAIGFFSLMSGRADVMRGLGLYAGLGVMLSYVNTLVLIPVFLSFLRPPDPDRKGGGPDGPLARALDRSAGFVLAHAKLVIGLTVGWTLLVLYGVRQVESHHRVLEEVMTDDPVYQGVRLVEEKLSGLLSFAVVVDGGEEEAILDPEILRTLEGVQHLLIELDPEFISRTGSLADLTKEIHFRMNDADPAFRVVPDEKRLLYPYLLFLDPETTEMFADSGFRRAAVRIRARDLGSERWIKLKPALSEYLDRHLPEGYSYSLTGVSDFAVTTLTFIVRDMLTSLGWSFFLIFGVIILLFRSFRVGLISVYPNVLPLLTTLGIMGVAGVPLRTSSAFIFTVSLGIAVNDTIHFIARFAQETRAGMAREEAARKVVRTSGRAMVITTLMLVSGFGIFALSNFKALRDFGILGSCTLLVALLLDLVLMPVLMSKYFKDRRWEARNLS